MKWRHTRENLKSGHEKQPQQTSADNNLSSNSTKMNMEASSSLTPGGYSSDCSSSLELSDADDDEDEIDVVEWFNDPRRWMRIALINYLFLFQIWFLRVLCNKILY